MELTGKITAKIPKHLFDGVPEDTACTIFISGVKTPIKAVFSDIEIKDAAEKAIAVLNPPPLAWDTGYPMTFSLGGEKGPQVSSLHVLEPLLKALPGLKGVKAGCPVKPCPVWTEKGPFTAPIYEVTEVIMHLNDQHRWSREQIADYLEAQDWDLQFATPEGAAS